MFWGASWPLALLFAFGVSHRGRLPPLEKHEVSAGSAGLLRECQCFALGLGVTSLRSPRVESLSPSPWSLADAHYLQSQTLSGGLLLLTSDSRLKDLLL